MMETTKTMTTASPSEAKEPMRTMTSSTSSTSSNNGVSSPMRLTPIKNSHHSNTPQRARFNSRDIARSYSASFGEGGEHDDLLPFELSRAWHTDWAENGGLLLLASYVGVIVIFQIIISATLDSFGFPQPRIWSWTVTNASHAIISTIYLHWLKGSLFDEQGEMSAMTLWEQLEGRPNTVHVKRTLSVVPTLLCYAACQFSLYDFKVCVLNVIIWIIQVGAKLPVMNGVRIFGINRTTGIDDYELKED